MSSALLGVAVLCLCSSSAAGAGAYFYNRKDAKYYENEINFMVNKIIETGARPAQCKLLRDFLTENIEDMEEKGTTFPVKGTQKGDIINVIMSWGDLKEMDKQLGRTKQEKLETLCVYDNAVEKAVKKLENKDTSVCKDLMDVSISKSIPPFVWDEKTDNFIKMEDFANTKMKDHIEDGIGIKICHPDYSPMASPDELSENAKNLISAIEQFDDGFSPEKCTDFKEKWDKMIDGRKLNEIFNGRGSGQRITDPELNFIYSKPKYKGVIQTLGEAFIFREDIPDTELPPGVTRVEESDEEIINRYCISDLKRKIDERVTLLKNEDIQGCDLYDDNWTTIREDWNTGFVWNDSNDKILVAHNYVSKALGETNEDLMDGKITARETLCKN
jgi:hypothetical protein